MKTFPSTLSLAAVFSVLFTCSQAAHGFYDPTVGRWLSRDPIGERGGKNLYGFVLNDPIRFHDRLGLDIGVGRGVFCCQCESVSVSFDNGGESLQWGWVQNDGNGRGSPGTWRFGENMHVKWKVKGNPWNCRYFQRESGTLYFWNVDDPTGDKKEAWEWIGGEVSQEYTDQIGATFRYPVDIGEWHSVVINAPTITLECVSSNGKKVTRPIAVPPPPDPGRFPDAVQRP
jgi:hypothetical protein